MTSLEQLKRFSTVVADSADSARIAAFRPDDACCDPALIAEAAQAGGIMPLLREALRLHERKPADHRVLDEVLVRVGTALAKAVPGRISTAVDARLAFDTAAAIARAEHIVELYERAGVERARVLVRLVATWEGIQAAKALGHHGIGCSLGLVLSPPQAVACGEAGVAVIEPHLGLIDAWQRAHGDAIADHGVRIATDIYTYFRKFGIDTEVMASGFDSVEQVAALAGCDLLAIRPELLERLHAGHDVPAIERRLDPAAAQGAPIHAQTFNEASFRTALNDDAMASEQLGAGIRAAVAETQELQARLAAMR